MRRKLIVDPPLRPDRVPAQASLARNPFPGSVSSLSLHQEGVWYFATDTGGAGGVVTLDWRIDPPENSFLDQIEWDDLIVLARRFVSSLVHCNQGGGAPKPEGLPSIFHHLLYLMRWMAVADIRSFAGIDASVAQDFIDHLARDKGARAERPRARETLAGYIAVLRKLYEQRALIFFGRHETMLEDPLGGRAAAAFAGAIADNKRKKGWIPSVPDDVWVPTVTEALRWLEEPARSVIQLGAILAELDMGDIHLRPDGRKVEAAILAGRDGQLLALWLDAESTLRWPGLDIDMRRSDGSLRHLYRKLLNDLRDACTIVIQAMLGLRISEVAALMAEPVHVGTGWPHCIRMQPSGTGMNEIFYVRGYVFKGKTSAEATEWVAGSRPRGTKHLPSAVKAMVILEQAFRPWRRFRRREELLVSLGDLRHTRDEGGEPAEVTGQLLNLGQNRFLRRRVELPAHRHDYRLSTHQWRKSFALYMVRSDERLLPAVSDHFKHLSIAATELGYVGSDAGLLGLMHKEGVRMAARTLLDACQGKATFAGKMALTIEDRTPHILKTVKAFGSDEKKLKSLRQILGDDGIRVWPSKWGRCLFRAEAARCHIEARGKVDLRAHGPDQGHRHPNVCCDCSNLLVAPVHGDFWRERHAENLASVHACANDGDPEGAAVAEARTRASRDVLDKLARKGRTRTLETDDA